MTRNRSALRYSPGLLLGDIVLKSSRITISRISSSIEARAIWPRRFGKRAMPFIMKAMAADSIQRIARLTPLEAIFALFHSRVAVVPPGRVPLAQARGAVL